MCLDNESQESISKLLTTATFKEQEFWQVEHSGYLCFTLSTWELFEFVTLNVYYFCNENYDFKTSYSDKL